MRTYVESVKRLYSQGKVSIEYVNLALADGKLTQEEYDYVTT